MNRVMAAFGVATAPLLAVACAGLATGGAGTTHTVPASVRVLTNEPFLSAMIAEDMVTVDGPGVRRRSVPLVASRILPDGREWHARDGYGDVTVRVLDRPCTDDMSGASFPWSGSLSVDGVTGHGCALPSTMSLPVEPYRQSVRPRSVPTPSR